MNQIEWRDVEGFEGIYQVSSDGQVRGLDRINCRGKKVNGTILSPSVTRDNYELVVLQKDCVKTYKTVHRLVAIEFIQNPNGLPQINHIDGNKRNNDVSNLEWVSGEENMRHAAKNNLLPKGENHWRVKLSDADVENIRIRYKNREMSQTDLAKVYGVSSKTVWGIVSGGRRKKLEEAE